jgi:hypothetical protein
VVVGVDQAWDDHAVRQADNFISSGVLLGQRLGTAYPFDHVPSYKNGRVVQLPVEVIECCQPLNVLKQLEAP